MTATLDVVIAGGGRVGLQAATMLDDRGHDVTIVERSSERCELIADEYVATVIHGDASNPTILEQTGIDRCDVIAGLTGESGLNLAVCMAAKQMTDSVRTVARIDTASKEAYTRFVDSVLFPERSGARSAVNEIIGSGVQALANVTGELDILEIKVAEGASAAGKELSEVRFPSGAVVVSDEAGDRIARPDMTLRPGERYILAVEPDVADEVMNLLRG